MKFRRRRGASVLELMIFGLVAVVPVFLLAGVAAKSYNMAMDAATAAEICCLGECCERFKERFDAYPPDMHDPAAAVAFMRRVFPQCPPKNYPKFELYSPASALPLWLAGIDGRGMTTDPTNPFGAGPDREQPLMEFNRDRLKPNAKGVLQYYSRHGTSGSPYVYFRAEAKAPPRPSDEQINSRELTAPGNSQAPKATNDSRDLTARGNSQASPPSKNSRELTARGFTPGFRAATSLVPKKAEAPVCAAQKSEPKPTGPAVQLTGYDGHPGFPPAKPYCNSKDRLWLKADSFQIISPGKDGRFGSGNHYPGGDNYDEANRDDISNFSCGRRMEKSIP